MGEAVGEEEEELFVDLVLSEEDDLGRANPNNHEGRRAPPPAPEESSTEVCRRVPKMWGRGGP